MLAVANMSHMIPNHVLRVGQTVRLDPVSAAPRSPSPGHPNSSGAFGDPELDESLENLNQLILELDPTFELPPVTRSPTSISSYTDESSPEEDLHRCVLVPRSCSPSPSRSIPIPTSPYTGVSCSPHGALIFCGSPSSSRPPLPCGSVHRRPSSARGETCSSPSTLLMMHSRRNSGSSMMSMSPGSDTSYMFGSCLSLASEDADGPESHTGSYSNGSRRSLDIRPSPTKPSLLDHFHDHVHDRIQSSPASLAGSLTDIPVLLVNGAPEVSCQFTPQEEPPKPFIPHSFQAHFHGSQPSMKFVMDTSKFWFRPHINRAEAEALVKDKQPGVFLVRDSTSYRGNFGLVMKVEADPNSINTTGGNRSEPVRHFLIESSAKGVRIKGSPHEPYFGSLSALVYQHTITAYALPCKLLLQTHASNFIYLNTVPTEMLTGPCAIKRAVTSTLEKDSKALVTPTIVNFKVSQKGVTLTDVKRKLFFRRHYPAHLLSYSGQDPDKRLMFGFVTNAAEAGMENTCHVFAEQDPLQSCAEAIEMMQGPMKS
ncbi:Tensin-4 [Merluccius polli]|uniref:Tensin-4 n=1 Tax=Merluccius polli TaxID=89951 RepID=A0AA47P1L3_MERPO|nr:Tensin-4 [Merluccius polli]